MIVRLAGEQDFHGFLCLAAQVECWFGPMVEDLGFCDTVRKHVRRFWVLVAVSSGPDLLGGLLFAAKAACHEPGTPLAHGRPTDPRPSSDILTRQNAGACLHDPTPQGHACANFARRDQLCNVSPAPHH
ncbi:hypothetical protein [Micromonospora sp. CA-244673]|uniref:hypothetical protein n=1 Tax=Micromonospora sp. CA-244673 TaxID=3239958 RepID=UPI003D8C0EB5